MVLNYLGIWNAFTNSPVLVDGVGVLWDTYAINTAATGYIVNRNLGSGVKSFAAYSYIVYDGSTWNMLEGSGGGGTTSGVTSVNITAGTGISATGGPITSSGSILVTNTSPDQTVVLNSGSGIAVSGTYPNFTISSIAGATSGITSINSLTPVIQYLASGSTGSDFNIVSVGNTHSFNLPSSSASNRGLLTSADWSTFNSKLANPMVIPGDLIYESSGTTAVRLPAGINGQILTVQASGLPAWQTSTALTNPMTTAGDMIYMTSGGTTSRIPAGTVGQQMLISAAGLPVWDGYFGLVEEINFEDNNSSIAATVYTLTPYAHYGFTVNTLKVIATSGTCSVAIKINGASVTGISAINVSNVIATGTASAANTVNIGDILTLVTSGTSSLIDIKASIKTTRT